MTSRLFDCIVLCGMTGC